MIEVKTELGDLNVYGPSGKMSGIVKIEVDMRLEQTPTKDSRILVLTFSDGTTKEYYSHEVYFDIHTNGGYVIKGIQPRLRIEYFMDREESHELLWGEEVQTERILSRIQRVQMVIENEKYPFIDTVVTFKDTYHSKTLSQFGCY